MDRLSSERRSWLMSQVKGINTGPEIAVRKMLFKLGYRYRLHCKKLLGTPDLVFPSRRVAVFVNGCFWHGHRGCPKGRLPKSRVEYWRTKIEANRKRDSSRVRQLRRAGWLTAVVWQCELKNPSKVLQRLVQILEAPASSLHGRKH
jgi:DNA mismatch endonuclease (patch repair protein)